MEQAETSEVIFMADYARWWEQVVPSKLDEETGYRLLQYVVNKYGQKRVYEEIGISRVTMWRLLERKSPVRAEYIKPILKLLTKEEFEKIVGARQKLRAIGIVKDDGSIDYSLALEILAVARNDEYLKNAILRFVVQEFRDDLRRMLGISFVGIVLRWSDDFEYFLMERKKRRKVRDPETLKYYRSIFKKYLEGRELSEELIDYVVNHKNKWLRNVFRHYIQYLYFRRRISPETFGWIMEVMPSSSWVRGVKAVKIDLRLLKKAMDFLREKQSYTAYTIC